MTRSEILARHYLKELGLGVKTCNPYRTKGIPDFYCHNEEDDFYCEVKQLRYGERINIDRLLTDSQKETIPEMISEGHDVKLIIKKGSWFIILNLDEKLDYQEVGRSKSPEDFPREKLFCENKG